MGWCAQQSKTQSGGRMRNNAFGIRTIPGAIREINRARAMVSIFLRLEGWKENLNIANENEKVLQKNFFFFCYKNYTERGI